ncbi:MAG: endopeptidase La [Bacteroidota bacterium]|jgi:ATP-dependent Lon protease|nr:endopeptidase La [Bacteroidota bacterium]
MSTNNQPDGELFGDAAEAMPAQHEQLPVLPLRNIVFFPGQIMPLFVGRPSSIRLVEEAHQAQRTVFVLTQRDSSVDVPHTDDLYEIGTVVRVVKIYTMPDGSKSVVVQGMHRARFSRMISEEPYLVAEVDMLHELPVRADDVELSALVASVRQLLRKLEGLLPDFNPEQLNLIMNTQDVGHFAFLIAALLNLTVPEKQELLELLDTKALLNQLTVALTRVIQRQQLSQKIQADVQESINKAQREYFLREQLRAIKKELGEEKDQLEVDEMRRKIEETNMPDDIRAVLEKELSRLSVMSPAAAEYSVTRNYVDWLLEMPWMVATEDNLDIAHVREQLDADHSGLESVKKRVLEYLAVRKLKKDMRGPILCFVGPPGVGKTSLGRSIAEALGRKYVRLSLGGVRDEAEIRGHRRTYVGALPGRIIQNIKKAGSNNPVLVLDEIDKVGMDFRGDPTSALLEVLDPEQNVNFSDHYLEVPFDLSRVLFIATANTLDTIQPALRDRMEIIEIPSYILDEKVRIARRHLLPKQLREHGIEETQLVMDDAVIHTIVERYTREAGVRNLERKLADVCRGVARQIAEGERTMVTVGTEELAQYISSRKYYPEAAERICRPGIATGLAWTPVGGDILFIEATKMKGKGRLTITGQVRDVMKESVQAAMSYIAANATEIGVDPDFRENLDIHVHVPAGGVPKDGPSAGVTMLAALTSLLTDRVVRNDLAMTGEITLRGQVLPIGGVKEKVLAAHRAGITQVLLPKRNADDLGEIPETVRKEITFHLVEEMREVLEIALPKKAAKRKSTKKSIEKTPEIS